MEQLEPISPLPVGRYDALVQLLLPTFGRTGREALDSMIEQLGGVLQARWAHLSVPAKDRPDCFQILAGCPGHLKEPAYFPKAGTTTEAVWERGEVWEWDKLPDVFPAQRAFFEEWKIEAICGVRLEAEAGRPLGVLVVAFGSEVKDRDLVAALLRLFALRAVGEIERLRAEEERFAAERRRLQAEAALAAQETQFAEIFENIEDSVFVLRFEAPSHFRYERLNRRFAEMVGRRSEEIRGCYLEDLHPPDLVQWATADLVACMKSGLPISRERELVLAGNAVTCRITFIPSRDEEGRVSRIIGIATDITALRQQERLYAESELIARIGGWELECATGRLLWTPGIFDIFERDPVTFAPTLADMIDLYTEESRPAIRQAIHRMLREGGDMEFFATAELPSGKRIHVRALGQAVMAEGKVVRLIGGVQDVTDQEEAHEQRLRLEAQLRRAQKLEAVGTLAGGIAHDFNNILAGIMGNTQLAMLELGAASPARRFLDNSYQGCLRARDLVRRILTFSRRSEQPRTVMPLRPIVAEALELLRASLPASVTIVTRFTSEDIHVLADAGQIHQILLNLGANAAQAMRPAGGTLTVELAPSPADDEWHRGYPQVRSEHCVRFTMKDTGPGIPAPLFDRIFEPFFTTKPVGEGSGLGLAMVHGIVENHGGVVVVESSPGQGAAFHVFLPGRIRHGGGASVGDDLAIQAPANGRETRTVLVVDDETTITELTSPMLEHLGYRARVFNDPHAALAAFAAAPEAYVALLCDLTMPGVDGVTLARSARALRADLPIVIMTGYLRPADLAPLQESGIRHHLPKPFSIQNLAAALSRAVQEVGQTTGM